MKKISVECILYVKQILDRKLLIYLFHFNSPMEKLDSELHLQDNLNNKDKSKNSISKRNNTDQQKHGEDTLNDTDCIPASQDAFADAFIYRSDGGKSSTEDFSFDLTQLMEGSSDEREGITAE